VIDVVVADEHPADVIGLDDREDVLEELFAVLGHAGVDDDGFCRADDHRVERHQHGRVALAGVIVDDVGLAGDLGRVEASLGGVEDCFHGPTIGAAV
jgi:hypothetical protein